MTHHKQSITVLAKAPSGIRGLDEITGGGLPRGRPTLPDQNDESKVLRALDIRPLDEP